MSGRWHVALGFALTGVELAADGDGRPFVTPSLVPREGSSGGVVGDAVSREGSSGGVVGDAVSREGSSGSGVGDAMPREGSSGSVVGDASPEPDPERLVAQLADAGWPRERIRAHALGRAADEQPWPHQVPDELRAGCGAAQFYAALGATRALLGLVTLESRPPSGRTRLNPDEERLLRDVPPHHGV
ncbi:MAG TPA: hypothetical protein PLQ63_10565 [Propionicimonas sp.]|nr:hypothetical protein [Propionicimonas sp.]